MFKNISVPIQEKSSLGTTDANWLVSLVANNKDVAIEDMDGILSLKQVNPEKNMFEVMSTILNGQTSPSGRFFTVTQQDGQILVAYQFVKKQNEPTKPLFVPQRGYAITCSTAKHPSVGTYGVATCVALALYDKKNKTAIIAHIDALTDLNSVEKLFDLISKEDTVAHLIGGCKEAKIYCIELLELIKKNDINTGTINLRIDKDAYMVMKDSASLAIDSQTGQIYLEIDPKKFEKGPPQLCQTSPAIKCCYNGIIEKQNTVAHKTNQTEKLKLGESNKNLSFHQWPVLQRGKYSSIAQSKTLIKEHKDIKSKTYCGFKKGFLVEENDSASIERSSYNPKKNN